MKKYLFGSFALVLAISFSAFTTPSHKFATTYFKYNGTSDAGYTVAANWSVSSQPFDACGDQVKTCTVESPTISTTSALATFLSTHNPQASVSGQYIIDSQRAAF